MTERSTSFLRFWRHLNRVNEEMGLPDVKCGPAWRFWLEAMGL